MVQGINKERIFEKNLEKEEYQKLMNQFKELFDLNIIAYCIMGNHTHMLIYTDNYLQLSHYMQKLNTSYGVFYNKRHNRVGFVFRNRYRTQPIKDKGHLYNCVIYIHNNPVKAKLCKKASDYKYSSYDSFLKDQKPEVVDKLFENEKEYEEAHNLKYLKDMRFIEEEESTELYIKYDVEKFIMSKKITMEEMQANDFFVEKIANCLKEAYGLSNRRIADFLGVSKERMLKVLKQ